MKFALWTGCFLAAIAQVCCITEYVAFAPGGTAGSAGDDDETLKSRATGPLLKWAELSYQKNVSSVDNVKFQMLASTTPEIGKLFDLDLSVGGGDGVALSAKMIGSKLYTYVAKKAVKGAGGGCCADTLRIYDRATGTANVTEWDLEALLAKVFANTTTATFHHATHTFDVQKDATTGAVTAFLMVQYTEPTTAALVNGALAFDTATGAVVETADGEAFFSFFKHAGTMATPTADTIFKVQYYKATTASPPEEWHGNGILRFTNRAGTKLLAITHRFGAEAVVMKDPFTYGAAQGGGAILQRFGTPKHFKGDGSGTIDYHHFGVNASAGDWTGGVHNVFYVDGSHSAALLGAETLSLFVNSKKGGTTSFVYEFELKLTEQQQGKQYADDVFATRYISAACGFEAQAQGGTRVFGDGVFIVADGVSPSQGGMFELVDQQGKKKDLKYPSSGSGDNGMVTIYDPYTRILKEGSE